MKEDFDYSYIQELIRLALEEKISDDEHKLLLLFFKYADKQSVENLLLEAFEKDKSAAVLRDAEDHFARIMLQVPSNKKQQPRKVYTFLRYAAAILLMLSTPLFFYKEELINKITYSHVEVENTVGNDSITIIPHVRESNNMVRLTLSDTSSRSYGEQPNSSALQLADIGVRIVQEDNKIRYEALKPLAQVEEIYHEIKVPFGRTFDVQLLDGTRIKLNSGSHIRYPLQITKDQMRLTLQGEAYFDVAKDVGRQFIVQIPAHKDVKKHQIEVLGTQFNIKAYPNDVESRSTLVSGAIQVRGITDELIQLAPNEQLIVNESVSVSPVDVASVISWMDNVFYFEKANLDEICKEISRWYGVEIAYDNSLQNTSFYVNISRKQPLSDILTILKANPSIEVKQTKERISISRYY